MGWANRHVLAWRLSNTMDTADRPAHEAAKCEPEIRHDSSDQRPVSRPVLSPRRSGRTPARSSMLSSRFVIGVSGLARR